MKRLAIPIPILVAAFFACASPMPPDRPTRELASIHFPPDPNLTRAEKLAFDIHAVDVAAWRATDRLYESGFDPKNAGVTGWLVVGEGSVRRIRFIREGSELPKAVFDVDLDLSNSSKGQVSHIPTGAPLSQEEQSMWRAQQLVVSSEWELCSTNYNTATIPEPDGSGWFVYLLSAIQESKLVVGRHYRAVVTALGDSLIEMTPLSNSCFSMPIDDETEMYVFTQLVSEEPLETSILLSLQIDAPIFFSVPSGSVWRADKGRLRLVRDGPAN